MSSARSSYRRPQAAELARRLTEPRRFMQVVAGPRQVGKRTLVQQVVEWAGVPVVFASADEPTLRGAGWIAQQARGGVACAAISRGLTFQTAATKHCVQPT